MQPEPIHDIAHLGHVELLTPKFEESRRFFTEIMGMTQSGEKDGSVYLRGWDDYERYSLKLTDSKTSGLAPCRLPYPLTAGARTTRCCAQGFGL